MVLKRAGIMFKNLQKFPFGRIVAVILIVILALVVVISIPSLGYLIIEKILAPPIWIVPGEKLRSVLDLALWILITSELIETVWIYFEERDIRIESVLSASMIALARKIIAVRLRDYDPLMVLGMAALIAAIGWNYYLVRKGNSDRNKSDGEKD